MFRRTESLVAASAALVLATGVVGCGADDDNPIADNGPTTTTVETTTTPAETQYFAGPEHVGKQVTVTAVVQNDLTAESVVLDAAAYGDDSLLVLSKGDRQELAEGQTVTVTGTVRQFSYDDYADEYGLAEAALFDAYANEEFLAADTIVAESPAPTS
jgi:hypothetical protein